MKIEYLFYTVGIIFIFSTILYFSKEFIRDLPDPLKLVLLIMATVFSFIMAEVFRGANK